MASYTSDISNYTSSSNLAGSSELTTLNTLKKNNYQGKGMDDNYIYFYHLDLLLPIPNYADSVQDTQSVTFVNSTPLSRSAPIYSYSHSGPRTVQVNFKLHRDMMKQLDYSSDWANKAMHSPYHHEGDDYVDFFIKAVQASVLPKYGASEKMVNPPIVALRLGKDIFIKGVITGSLGLTYNYPILTGNKYSNVDISFNISEVTPFGAEEITHMGSYRLVDTTLERNTYVVPKTSTK